MKSNFELNCILNLFSVKMNHFIRPKKNKIFLIKKISNIQSIARMHINHKLFLTHDPPFNKITKENLNRNGFGWNELALFVMSRK